MKKIIINYFSNLPSILRQDGEFVAVKSFGTLEFSRVIGDSLLSVYITYFKSSLGATELFLSVAS